jgi:hypothetical protein
MNDNGKLLRRGITEVNRLACYDTVPLLVWKDRVGTTVDKLRGMLEAVLLSSASEDIAPEFSCRLNVKR